MEIFLEHLGRAFVDMLLISMPCVLVAAAIGLVVGILQAVTQVQEQTIAAAPKILGVFLTIMVLGGFFTNILTEYMLESVNIAFNIIPKQDDFVLPANGYAGISSSFLNDNFDETKGQQPTIDKIMKTPGKAPLSEREQGIKFNGTSQKGSVSPDLMEKNKIIESRR